MKEMIKELSELFLYVFVVFVMIAVAVSTILNPDWTFSLLN
tara:strand:+ start:80024 stop:80146 length:123 start_codon:yes stop_codon:yes gene_type:complete